VWSPLVDRYALPALGRRRGWMFLTQLLLLVSIPLFGALQPALDLWTIAYLAAAVAFFSATQDIALDAFRRELLPDAELGLGNSIHVQAYRIASLVPGALSLILADHLPWSSVFTITAMFMLPGLAMTLVVNEPSVEQPPPKTLIDAIVLPFREFLARHGVADALLVLAFIFLYKLGDSMATALATPFYLDIGFTKSEIGLIAKNAALWPSVIGGLLGGLWMVKIGINRALWLFGAVQMLSILGFAWLAHVNAADRLLLAGVIGFEALGVGLGTAAFVAFIARTTDPRYTATQFALFTSLAVVPRSVVNASTGWMVEAIGWFDFYVLCFALALPGMALLVRVAPWNEALPGAASKA
jgi:PAT family beta-lactamase induction signal transducer AmpG